MGGVSVLDRVTHDEDRAEVVRETLTMVLYVSVVMIAELAALPEEHFSDGRVTGATGNQLLEIIWGTALGLALAHWFAFRLAGRAFRGEHVHRHDTIVGLAQVGGAVFVAAVSSLPVLFLSDLRAQETTGDVPAVVIGVLAYLIARHRRQSRFVAAAYGITALAVGVLVALIKLRLAGK